MATVKELKATARPKAGKGAARAERREGRVPAVIYGDNQAPVTISIDDKYLFTIKDDVANVGDAPVTIYPFGLISRHGTPHVSGYYILHEGLIGVLGDQGLQEYGYKKMDETKAVEFKVSNAWMGITDKFGHILVHDKSIAAPTAANKLQLGDKLYYRGYLKKNNACYDGPKFANAVTEFTSMEGFLYLDFCTWNLQPNDKCADLSPHSDDCTSDVMCAQQ